MQAFHRILFESPADGPPRADVAEPDFFGDLNLDQVVADVTRGYDEYNLVPFFRTNLPGEGAVVYRHDVFRDLEPFATSNATRYRTEFRHSRSGPHSIPCAIAFTSTAAQSPC
ncbi:hypothetical protein [Paraburkholderia sp. J12]|uniref:hypothetical protein n=1 Tax=Paraburkholderia sp. J12 TaxID=2805432 RepID=UPI002ABE423E|nr:hypothetical protein [Paraburkholderia sp. J12]